MTESRGSAEPDVARVAKIFADSTRAHILMALTGARSMTASALADEAGVTRQAASAQLAALTAAGMITVERSGRNCHYQLTSSRISELLESLAGLTSGVPTPNSLRAHGRAEAMRQGRVCYDHIAGRLGVTIVDALVERGALSPASEVADSDEETPAHPYRLGDAAATVFSELGVPEERLLERQRRPLLRFCLDWSEHRHHLSGSVGAELLTAFTNAKWIARTPRTRAVRLTAVGEQELGRRLGLNDIR